MEKRKKIVYVVLYGKEIHKKYKCIFVNNKTTCTTKRKYKIYKTWSGVFNFLLTTPYTYLPIVTRCEIDVDGCKSCSITVYSKPKIYMGFYDLAAIAGTADSVDGCK